MKDFYTHNTGIRGHFYRYKKTKDEDLEKITEKDFKSLKLHEGVHIELGIEQVDKLYNELKKRKVIQTQIGFEYGDNEYIVIREDDALKVTDQNLKEIIKQIIDQKYSNEFWTLLKGLDQDLADQITVNHVYNKRKKSYW